ncbi:hypothetical protein E8A73_027320 [Polyangium aurulentum]|nr:hypothetical protein E8A73_027320 [Polyangium aurulentum]
MTLSMRSLVAAVAAMTVVAAGCGSDPETPPQPAPPDAGTQNVAPPPPPPPPPPPEPTACDATTSLGLTTMITGRAKTDAPAPMKPEGGPLCMVVPEGQTVSTQTMNLEPGHCYTVLAQGAAGVSEVDVQLILDTATALPPALAALAQNPTLAVDQETGASASIGPKQTCYAWPFPLPGLVKVVAKARTGTGPIALQVYKKKK